MATQSFTYPASDGDIFTQQKWDQVVGESSSLDRNGDAYPITVTGAVVAGDGLSVEITLETDAVLTPEEQALIGFALRRMAA